MVASSLCNADFCLNPAFFAAESPRSHFDDLLWAMTTVFQILSGENWNAVMYDCWRAIGPPAVIYMMCLMVVGVMIVLELFVAILLGNFEGDDDDEEEDEEDEEEEEEGDSVGCFDKFLSVIGLGGAANTVKVTPAVATSPAADATGDDADKIDEATKEVMKLTKKQARHEREQAKLMASLAAEKDKTLLLNGVSFWIWPVQHRFRQMVARTVLNNNFDYAILVLIMVSSIMLARGRVRCGAHDAHRLPNATPFRGLV